MLSCSLRLDAFSLLSVFFCEWLVCLSFHRIFVKLLSARKYRMSIISPVCRVCIARDIRMHNIEAQLLITYRNLTGIELESDGLPLTACYICYTQLRKCAQFSLMAQMSATLLHGTIHKDIEVNSINNLKRKLTFTPLQYLSINNPFIKEEVVVKKELIDSDNTEEIENIMELNLLSMQYEAEEKVTIKMERAEDFIESEDPTVLKQDEINLLMKHIERPYICDICGKAFPTKNSLIPHLRYHTGHRPYPCNVCHKKFTEAGNLRRHYIVHSKEKAFICEKCQMTFTEAGSLRRHVLLHSGVKLKHPCGVCGKVFLRIDIMRRHMVTHNGMKPHACDRCDKRYTEPGSLKRHKQSHMSSTD